MDGKEVWVSLGSKDGLEKGEALSVYEPCPKRNSKGEVVTLAYKKTGQLRLLTVKTEKSMGEYSGEAAPAEGWIVAAAEVDIDELD